MKTTIFNFKRFSLLLKKDTFFNGKNYLLQLIAAFLIMTIVIYLSLFSFKTAPVNKIIGYRFSSFIPILYIYMVLFSFNIFKFYRTNIKTQNFIICPNSQLEKLLHETLKTIIAFMLFPLIFAVAFKTGFYIKSLDWDTLNTYPTISKLLYMSVNATDTNELINRLTDISLGAICLSLLYVLGNLIFKKYRLIKTTIFITVIFIVIFFISTWIDKNGIENTMINYKILGDSYSFVAYLIILKVLIFFRFKKIQA